MRKVNISSVSLEKLVEDLHVYAQFLEQSPNLINDDEGKLAIGQMIAIAYLLNGIVPKEEN